MAGDAPNLSVLDRSIPLVIPSDSPTKSTNDNVPAKTQELHRWHGASVLLEACQLLNIGCFPSAAILYHRSCHVISLRECSVWSVATASALLACKLEEIVIKSKQIITAFAHIYRRRYLLVDCDSAVCSKLKDLPFLAISTKGSSLSVEEKWEELKNAPSISPTGPSYKEWHDSLVQTEQLILRRLGFIVHWIPTQNAHCYLPKVLEELSLENDSEFCSKAWSYCNDAYRGAVCVEEYPHVLACSAVFLAALDLGVRLPTVSTMQRDWWKVLCTEEADVPAAAGHILESTDKKNIELVAASKAFLPSLVKDGAFNDPNQFIWYKLDQE